MMMMLMLILVFVVLLVRWFCCFVFFCDLVFGVCGGGDPSRIL